MHEAPENMSVRKPGRRGILLRENGYHGNHSLSTLGPQGTFTAQMRVAVQPCERMMVLIRSVHVGSSS